MTEQTKTTYDDLTDAVIAQLANQNYKESTLIVYQRTYRRIKAFMLSEGVYDYSPRIGIQFLERQNVAPSTLVSYKCAVRRLDDYYKGKEFRSHHEGNTPQICNEFDELLNEYLNACVSRGNKPGTIIHKQYACTLFLNFLSENGYNDISLIDADIITRALLIFSNTDRYADVKLLLRYLYEGGLIHKDYSGIIPRVKRRIPIPSVYTIDEIKRIEKSINVNTDTGKRNIAIIRLATRMGLRSGDIAKLKENEIDFDTGYIRFIQEKTNTPLELQMPLAVSDSIYTHLENSKKNHFSDGYVFHSMTAPYGRLSTNIIRHLVNQCMDYAEIEIGTRKHGPHAFRSSLASLMIEDNCSYETVRKILGHSNPDVILHYAKTDIERLRLCAISPPEPRGLFKDYLTGKKVFGHV